MSKFVVAIFSDEAKAHQGARALQALREEGSITLYASASLQGTRAESCRCRRSPKKDVAGQPSVL
jgi:hypothetical protein